MPTSPQVDTMANGLQKLLGQLGTMMAYQDADTGLLTGLQTAIADYLKQGAEAASQGQSPQQPPQQGMGGPPPGQPGGMGMGPGMMGMQPPPADELARMLGAGQ